MLSEVENQQVWQSSICKLILSLILHFLAINLYTTHNWDYFRIFVFGTDEFGDPDHSFSDYAILVIVHSISPPHTN